MTYIEQSKGTNPQGEAVPIPVGGTVFVSNVPLNAGQSVDSGWIPTSGYGALLYVIRSDQESAADGVKVEFSDDGQTPIMAGSPFPYSQTNQQIQRVLVPKGKYTRITYKNGTTPQTTFRFEVKLSTTLIQFTESSLNAPITGTELAQVAVSVTEAPDSSGIYNKIERTGSSMNVNVTNPQTPETRNYTELATISGISFVWTTGSIAGLAVATNLRALLDNPANSGRVVIVQSLVMDNGGSTDLYATMRLNPTGNLPTTSRGTGFNMNTGSAITSGGVTMYADATPALTSGMTGGVVLPAPFISPDARTEFLQGSAVFILTPGNKIGISIPIGIGTSNNYQIVVYGIVA